MVYHINPLMQSQYYGQTVNILNMIKECEYEVQFHLYEKDQSIVSGNAVKLTMRRFDGMYINMYLIFIQCNIAKKYLKLIKINL